MKIRTQMRMHVLWRYASRSPKYKAMSPKLQTLKTKNIEAPENSQRKREAKAVFASSSAELMGTNIE